jgi:hypothetical protein
MCPTNVGVKVAANCILWPAARVTGRFRLALKFGSVRVSFEMVMLPDPPLVMVTVWLCVWPMGTPPYQILTVADVKVLFWVDDARVAADIRRTAMAKLIETSLPRALGESELMSASFNG